ncbi:MAG: hypothetical protein ACLP1X_19410 [Polyangiaceae bacterium]
MRRRDTAGIARPPTAKSSERIAPRGSFAAQTRFHLSALLGGRPPVATHVDGASVKDTLLVAR